MGRVVTRGLWSAVLVLASSSVMGYETKSFQAYRVNPQTRPNVDGNLDDDCWNSAPAATGFSAMSDRSVSSKARAHIAYDDDHIYVAFWCPRNEPGKRTVELFLDPFLEHRREAGLGPDLDKRFYTNVHPRIFRFEVSAGNEQESDVVGMPWYTVPWTSASQVGANYWSAELSIPVASLAYFESLINGKANSGWTDEWGVNFIAGDFIWVPFVDHDNQKLPVVLENPLVFPATYGTVTDIDIDPTLHTWLFLLDAKSGDGRIGPRAAGDVPVVMSLNNFTGEERRVKVIARSMRVNGISGDPAFKPQEGISFPPIYAWEKGPVWKVPVTPISWNHGSFSLPITKPGRHLVLLTIVEAESGKNLAHRPLLIDPVTVGDAIWDRSFYMKEPFATLKLRCHPTVDHGESVTCNLHAQGIPDQVIQRRSAKWDHTHKAHVRFDLRSLPPGDYDVTTTFSSHEGHPFVTRLRKLEHRNGAVQYTDSRGLLRDGKPFFPFGMYWATHAIGEHEGFAEEYSSAGLNSFMLEFIDVQGYVDLATEVRRENGIIPIAELSNVAELRVFYAGDYSWRELLQDRLPIARQAVRKVAREAGDSILAWNTRDEPNENMYNMVKGFREIIDEEDPYHPTLTTIYTPHLFPAYVHDTDILAADIYPSFPDKGPVDHPGKMMGKAVKDMRGKPVFAVLQAFHPFARGKNREGYRLPNRQELRFMTFHCIVRGVTGVFFFALEHHSQIFKCPDDPRPQTDDYHPEVWEALKELAGDVRTLAPVLLSERTTSARPEITGPETIETRVYDHEGLHYLLAVNTEKEPARQVRFSIKQTIKTTMKTKTVKVLFEDRKVAIEDNSWIDDFDGLGVHIYEITTPKGYYSR